MIGLAVAVGAVFAVALLALSGRPAAALHADDEAVLAQCALLWPIFALMQPLNGAVFALDGILIGASDGPYIAGSMVVAFAACAVVARRRPSRATGASAACGRRSAS